MAMSFLGALNGMAGATIGIGICGKKKSSKRARRKKSCREAVRLCTGTSIPARWACRRRCRYGAHQHLAGEAGSVDDAFVVKGAAAHHQRPHERHDAEDLPAHISEYTSAHTCLQAHMPSHHKARARYPSSFACRYVGTHGRT